jgi:outer membrane immunogenic protein
MFLPNWTAKAEYLYYYLDTVRYQTSPLASFVTGSPFFTNVSQLSARFSGNIVRAGLNYHFTWLPPPVVAKY